MQQESRCSRKQEGRASSKATASFRRGKIAQRSGNHLPHANLSMTCAEIAIPLHFDIGAERGWIPYC